MDIGTGDVLVIMGSQSDAEYMFPVHQTLENLNIRHNCRIASAHRTPERIEEIAEKAFKQGYKIIIAGAGLAAALAGDLSARCWTIPVLAVAGPSPSHSAEQAAISAVTHLPPGTPVLFCGVGKIGAINAALGAATILGLLNVGIRHNVTDWRQEQKDKVPEVPDFSKFEEEQK